MLELEAAVVEALAFGGACHGAVSSPTTQYTQHNFPKADTPLRDTYMILFVNIYTYIHTYIHTYIYVYDLILAIFQ